MATAAAAAAAAGVGGSGSCGSGARRFFRGRPRSGSCLHGIT